MTHDILRAGSHNELFSMCDSTQDFLFVSAALTGRRKWERPQEEGGLGEGERSLVF